MSISRNKNLAEKLTDRELLEYQVAYSKNISENTTVIKIVSIIFVSITVLSLFIVSLAI